MNEVQDFCKDPEACSNESGTEVIVCLQCSRDPKIVWRLHTCQLNLLGLFQSSKFTNPQILKCGPNSADRQGPTYSPNDNY
eukprot:5240461-Amphidinium_carterae.1